VRGKITFARLASGFVFLLANPEFYSYLASWRVVIHTLDKYSNQDLIISQVAHAFCIFPLFQYGDTRLFFSFFFSKEIWDLSRHICLFGHIDEISLGTFSILSVDPISWWKYIENQSQIFVRILVVTFPACIMWFNHKEFLCVCFGALALPAWFHHYMKPVTTYTFSDCCCYYLHVLKI
jgi:hypothetical protein